MERQFISDVQAKELLVTGDGVIVNAGQLKRLLVERDTIRAELAAANKKLGEWEERGKEWTGKYADMCERITARAEKAEAELAAAKEQLELDRTTCHDFIKALDVVLDGRFWLTEGRGSYAWDDDRYRTEFNDAAVELRAIIDPMRKMAHNLCSRLPTTEAVIKARVDLTARADKAEAENAALKERVELLQATIDSVDKDSERDHEELLKFLRSSLGKKDVHGPYDGVSQLVARNAALKAHVERLREELTWQLESIENSFYHDECAGERISDVLAATPEQSLAKLRAETLREAQSKLMPDVFGMGDYYAGMEAGIRSTMDTLQSMADRLEKEAAELPANRGTGESHES